MPQGLRAAMTSKTPAVMAIFCAGEIASTDNYQKLDEERRLIGRSALPLPNKRRGVTLDVSEYCQSYKVSLGAAIWQKSFSHNLQRRNVTSCLCLNYP